MSHTCGNILVHLIFSTKARRPLITADLEKDLFAYLGGIVRGMNGTALIVNGIANHVHMLLRIRPICSVAEVTRVVKTNSSRWAREQGHINFAWQTGYGAFSVSESNVGSVTNYIAAQKEHHKKYSFEDEFLSFLKKNHIEYDEKYLWG
jgi:REP element-mobilizing transposase RayT